MREHQAGPTEEAPDDALIRWEGEGGFVPADADMNPEAGADESS